MKIILIHGGKRHGKDYLARMLKIKFEELGRTAEILSFAKPLKEIISTTLELTEEQIETYKNNPQTYELITRNSETLEEISRINFRKLLQLFGTEAMKTSMGDRVWVELMLENIKSKTVDYILIPDFRFKSETISPYTIKIENSLIKNIDSHQSENELQCFKFKYTIDNTGKKNLKPQIAKLATDLW